jgi:ferric-dicitrate binding protein FerR (iron transport regulator)
MKTTSLLCFCLLMLSVCRPVAAQDAKDVALVLKTSGKVDLSVPGRSTSVTAKRGHRLHDGYKVQTGEESQAALVFTDDKSLLRVRENSNVTVQGTREKEGIVKRLSLAFGSIWAKVTKQQTSLRVETPSGVATVKGTEFYALYLNGIFIVYCQEGLMELVNQFGTMLLGVDEMAQLTQNAGPERLTTDPDDVFNLAGEQTDLGDLEIMFEDADGNKKSLILEF